ncbi:hypothetical protein CHARACLAT_016059 [Characodon lateralis]|uniref:Uncharacterized protein n=1 Tax=Characodon lateralis TaxID=208331 RepID=A0ABU7D753_9TELE|nr:hypothetical protein [Characodon lateralis]
MQSFLNMDRGREPLRLLFRLPPAVARERQARRARHQSRRAAGSVAAVLGGDGFCKGRLAQEDVKELE